MVKETSPAKKHRNLIMCRRCGIELSYREFLDCDALRAGDDGLLYGSPGPYCALCKGDMLYRKAAVRKPGEE